jgi:threonine dehydrogenase-like Zn-dependent dehydrogenase
VYRQELRLVGVRSTTPRHLRAALAALADGSVAADDLVTDVLPLDRFAEGVERYRRGDALKVVFTP